MRNVSRFQKYKVAKGKRKVWLLKKVHEACNSKGFAHYLAGKVWSENILV